MGWPGLQSKFQASLGLIVRACLSLMKYFQKGKIILLVHRPFKKGQPQSGPDSMVCRVWPHSTPAPQHPGPAAPRLCSGHAGDPAMVVVWEAFSMPCCEPWVSHVTKKLKI